MNKELFEKYATLKIKQKAIENEISELAPSILTDIMDAGVDKVEIDAGAFIVENRKKWNFSEHAESMRNELKELEKKEMADGTATFDEMQILKFLITKIKE